MSQPVGKAPMKETSNHPQGRSGSGTKKLMGPIKSVKKNPTMGGGIFRATKGRK